MSAGSFEYDLRKDAPCAIACADCMAGIWGRAVLFLRKGAPRPAGIWCPGCGKPLGDHSAPTKRRKAGKR